MTVPPPRHDGDGARAGWTVPALPPVRVEAVELMTVRLPLIRPLASARGVRAWRDVLLVHLRAEVDGWAECPVEPEPSYDEEYTAGAAAVLADHLLPRMVGVGDLLSLHRALGAVRGHRSARASLEVALLDSQLRAGGRSMAGWLGAERSEVAVGATVGLPLSRPTTSALDAEQWDRTAGEVEAAVAAGAARVRLKVVPGCAAMLGAMRARWPELALQVDANGSFDPRSADHLAELEGLDALGLTCIEQPFPPDDLLAHAALARRIQTAVGLDESITSPGALRSALALAACSVVCAKPARVGGPLAVRELHDVAVEAGVDLFVGGMCETAVGRAVNLAVAALPGATLPADADPRGWFAPDLATNPGSPAGAAAGIALVNDAPGASPPPDPDVVAAHLVARREVRVG